MCAWFHFPCMVWSTSANCPLQKQCEICETYDDISQTYFALFLNSPSHNYLQLLFFRKSLLCTPWSSTMGWRISGDEALGVQHLQHHAKWLGARTGCLAQLAMISLPVNVVPFSGLKTLLASRVTGTHLYPRMTCLVEDIWRHSYEPCTLPEVTSKW